MHKGLYWSQLTTGIGIGLILVSSIWIATEHISIADALAIPRVGVDQAQNGSSTAPTNNASAQPINGAVQPHTDSSVNAGVANPAVEGVSNQAGNAVPTGTMGLDSPNGSGEPSPNQLPGEVPVQGTGIDQSTASNVESDQTKSQVAPTPSTSNGIPNSGSGGVQNPSANQAQSGEFQIVYAFVVDPGDSSERIASKLEAYGLASSQDFLQAIHAQNLDRKLKAGHYELTEGESVYEIIAKLTR